MNSADREVAIETLVLQGYSRQASTQMMDEAMSIANTRLATNTRIAKIRSTPYQDWLRDVSPEMVWDKPFQALICNRIDNILAGRIRRLGVFLPPRSGKSQILTIRLPVRWIEQHPSDRVIVGAYNRELAVEFISQSLKLYSARNPNNTISEAQEEWVTKAGGSVLAVGVGSGVTGRGADLMIIDDPVKGAEEAQSPAYQKRLWNWWQSDMRTRLNNIATTPAVLIQTRWSDLDLAGRILDQDKKRKLWHVISFPAIAKENDILGRAPGESLWPERMPIEELLELQTELKLAFEALYQQDPTPASGGMIDLGWFWYGSYEPTWVVSRCRFWDLAGSAVSRKNYNPDFSAGCRMALFGQNGDKNNAMYSIEDLARVRAEPGERDNFIEAVARADGPEVLQIFEEVDDGDKSVTASLRARLQPFNIQVAGAKPRNDKVVRSTNMRSALENGKLMMLEGRWNGEFVAEMVRFPNGKHDDQVDAASGAFNHLVSRTLRVSIE